MTDLGATELLLMRRGLNVKKSGRLRRDLPLLLMLGLLFGDLSSSKGEFRRLSICLRVCVPIRWHAYILCVCARVLDAI